MEWYESLSKACFDCPYNITDCDLPHCIGVDGARRAVVVVNRQLPGPSIDVCKDDTVIVDVKNSLLGESTTIHWHGLHQRANPYMVRLETYYIMEKFTFNFSSGWSSAYFTVSHSSAYHV